MRIPYLFIIALSIVFNSSCNENTPYGPPNEKPEIVLKDYNSFWSYYSKYTSLSEDFIPLDVSSNVITKEHFFNYLMNGECIPLRLTSIKDTYYKLYKIPSNADESISTIMMQTAERAYKLFAMEGKPLQHFDLVDLNGEKYTKESTKGNILVLKCWFVHCQKCNEEIPDCNKLVTKFKNHSDIKFISLALDNKADLKKFLTKTTLDYAVVANQKKYLLEDLRIDAFPTHLIINRDGIVVKVLGNFEEVEPVLNKLISNTQAVN